MTAGLDAVGFYDKLTCALGEIAGDAGVVDHGRYLSPQANVADAEADERPMIVLRRLA